MEYGQRSDIIAQTIIKFLFLCSQIITIERIILLRMMSTFILCRSTVQNILKSQQRQSIKNTQKNLKVPQNVITGNVLQVAMLSPKPCSRGDPAFFLLLLFSLVSMVSLNIPEVESIEIEELYSNAHTLSKRLRQGKGLVVRSSFHAFFCTPASISRHTSQVTNNPSVFSYLYIYIYSSTNLTGCQNLVRNHT